MRFPVNLSPQSPSRKLMAAAVLALISCAIAIGARYLPGISVPMGKVDDLLYDSLYRLRPVHDQTGGPVVIVAVDDKSLYELSHQGLAKKEYSWPWPRSFWGYIISYLGKCGAKAVAIDMVFTEPSEYNDESGDDAVFAGSVDKSKIPVVLGTVIPKSGHPESFAPPVKRPIFGAVNVGDDVVFRLYQPLVNGVPSLAARAVETAGGSPFREPFLLHYYGPHQTRDGKRTFRYLSASHVLAASIGQKNTGIDPQMFRDKIVLIGAITIGTYDLKSSPLSALYPGVEVQATALANMLAGQRARIVPLPWAVAATFFAALVGAMAVAFPRRVSLKLIFAAITFGLLFAVASGLFLGHRIRWLPLAAPTLALLLATIGAFAWSYLAEGRQRKLVLKALSQYISPEVAAEIDRNPGALKLGGERRDMTVMFTDIQGFTALSEQLDEHRLTTLLNYYLDEMSSLILSTNGTLDKYIGDAIMSFWNAPLYQPDHAILACRAALAMEKREREIQPRLKELGAMGMFTRIGINTGPMVFGNMGSSQKFNYSVLGDSVNLASRLESANKFYGSQILISQPTAEQVKDKLILRQVDLLRVKGKLIPMAVFEVMGEEPADADLLFRKTEYEAAFGDYQRQNWDEAESHLTRLHEKFPMDGPASALLDRIAYLREHPPGADWDGVYVAKGK
jgi:adenylate cyclase